MMSTIGVLIRKLWIIPLLVIAVCALYLSLRYLRKPTNHPEFDPRKAEADRLAFVTKWQSMKTASLTGIDVALPLEQFINRKADRTQAGQIGPYELSESQRKEFLIALKGLLEALGKDTFEDYWAYTVRQGEVPDPEFIEATKLHLSRSHAITSSYFTGKTGKDVYETYYRVAGCKSHWESLVVDDGQVAFSKAEHYPAQSEDAREEDFHVFRNVVHHARMFKAKNNSPNEEIRNKDFVLLGEAKIVILYDQERFNEPRPHYIRFWWDSIQFKWHAHELTLFPTIEGTYPEFLF